MTLRGEMRAVSMNEVRQKLRVAVEVAETGAPVMVLEHGHPAAVMLRFDEVERAIRLERALSALHGLEVYPELARDTSELAALVSGRVRPTLSAIRRLAGERREILAPLRTVGVREMQRVVADVIDRVQAGQPMTISLDGGLPAVLVSPGEFDRLRELARIESWFRAAGLDLTSASEQEIADFVRRFRERPATVAESAAS
ncbi:MAG: type II toxin-antitoxin system prevent-host-death family antitoxin [Chloroflexi bacterium]|nr:type II toxin-antitoxin system prevent-host-death family antitoxin [Chloroflexota bacterium]